ncbi:helix-turn-helix transcriptional regulator [Candidatus Saccharibacteria bacterium]|nr:helix-turn-helix transcriptional regulator [Candidatus Saccharibacteria bacterium]
MIDKPLSSQFRPLGKRLKALRDLANETLAEASGAVEIDVKQLASYELGQAKPSEDVLLLLISHFGAKDDEAVRIWELAGYGTSRVPLAHMANDASDIPPSVIGESHVLFTDVVDVIVNNYGVVMNFMQSSAPHKPPATVARVGMSREHAKSVLQILQATLAQTERSGLKLPKKLIAPDSQTPDEAPRN